MTREMREIQNGVPTSEEVMEEFSYFEMDESETEELEFLDFFQKYE